ncbi:MAG: M3 family metallopeptidase [Caulobacteraceae bacterium]|nr:M3 family metallopeptidase [Caulobacteraceae bacterium]
MNRRNFLAASTAVAAVTAAQPVLAAAPAPNANPLLNKWTGPYGGVPPFDRIKVEHFKPAIEQGIAENLREVEAVANNPAPATFENTIAALEDTGRLLSDVTTSYGIWGSTLNTDDFQAVQEEMNPKLAALSDQISSNAKLFARVDAVYNSPDKARLTPEQQRLTWVTWNGFVRSGAKLNDAQKARVAQINQELSGLFTQFSKNLLADEKTYTVLEQGDLGGLSESYVAGAASVAAAKGMPGKWVVANTRSSVDPFLTESTNRGLREKVWKKFVNRGDNGDANDNNAIIRKILKLRVERANLYGYPTHAHYILENRMAKTPERALALMEAVWTPAVARVHEEVRDMQAIADKEGAGITIEPWDYRFYQEKVRKARYDLDSNEVKQYLQLEKLREGMHWAAGQLYGFEFTQVHDVPVAHPDIRVWEVKRAGRHVGLWYFDPYARDIKRSGAWMNAYRTQEKFRGDVTTIVSNNCNFVKVDGGKPVLISWDDAETLFHEFGHALHGLNSDVNYPTLAGTAVARDYVEFPSQLNEHWLSTKEVLSRFALHHETGQPIPDALVAKIKKASTFNQGFATVEYLASALIDMKLHLAGAADIDPDAFERDELNRLGMPKELVMRHRTPQFGHVFSSDGYSAAYYSYLWADTLTADAAEAFVEAGSFYDRPTAKRLHDTIMSRGNTIDPAEQFRAFRGRDVKIGALMRDRGFPVPEGA